MRGHRKACSLGLSSQGHAGLLPLGHFLHGLLAACGIWVVLGQRCGENGERKRAYEALQNVPDPCPLRYVPKNLRVCKKFGSYV